MADIFKLVGSIFIDSAEANNSLSKTEKNAEGVGNAFVDTAKKVGEFAVGVGTVCLEVGQKIYNLAQNTAEVTDNIDKMSKKLGISTDAFQELDFALSQSGVDINSFSTGAKTLLKNMDAVTEGNKTAIKNFEALGVSVKESDGSLRSQEDVLFETIEALQQMEDSSEKSRLAQELFGKQGQEILPLLDNESESISALRKEAHDLGIVIDEETIDAGVELTDTMDKVNRTFASVTTQIGSAVMPMVQKVLDWIIAHMPQIQAIVTEVVGAIKDAIEKLQPVFDALSKVFEGLLSTVKEVWTNGIKPIFEGIIDFITGVFTGSWERAFEGLVNIVKGVFGGIVSVVKAPINAVIGILNGFIEGINSIKIPDWIPLIGGASPSIPTIPYLAKGGSILGGGSAIVGEDGAELVNLPQGATVTPLNDNNNAFVGMEKRLEQMQESIFALASAISGYKPQIVLDSGILVGEIAPGMDAELGRLSMQELRYV